MKRIVITLFVIFQSVPVFSQTQFLITGKTNYIIDGKAILYGCSAASFYPSNLISDTIVVKNHNFAFKGTIKYPLPFTLTCINDSGKSVSSEFFFVDRGKQYINFDSTSVEHDPLSSGHGISVTGSKANDEYTNTFLPLFNNVNIGMLSWVDQTRFNAIIDPNVKKDSIIASDLKHTKMKETRDSLLYYYASQHPESIIVPFLLYDAILRHDYSNYYYKAFEKIKIHISPEVNSGLTKLLDIQKVKGIGNVFPLYDFIEANIADKDKHAKYTLVDFWFAACGPCIFYFNSIRDTYKKYHDKGFNIVAISIDNRTAIAERDRMVKKFQYDWLQILDEGGIKTKSINIRQFPSTFLLDSKGKIIQTHIDSVLLNSFLEKNL